MNNDSADGATLLSKVLAQTNYTKLTQMLTLTLNPNPTKLNPYICAHIVDTLKNFFRIYKRNF